MVNILMTRIVFLLYAEDAGLLQEPGAFYKYLADYKAGQTAAALRELFAVLKTPEEQRDPYLNDTLKQFPYINGGLFEQSVTIPQFTDAARPLLLREASAGFDWTGISPTIFGAVFESTLNPATRRAGGMHYTSIENIHKLIGPLFLDDLQAELRDIEGEKTEAKRRFRLAAFRKKIAALRFLDPACGSGNFLTETYLCLRRLENRVLQNLHGGQMAFAAADPVQVGIHQFYGVEINDFAVEVAKTALWIAELQMLEATREILDMWIEPLPLKDNAGIRCANALRLDWNEVLPAGQCGYVIGNPPFVGKSLQSKEQKEDMAEIFNGVKSYGNLDYVTCWFAMAARYTQETEARCAFVATNSICQGIAVPPLWSLLLGMGIHIDFAHTSFVWDSEAADKAKVHCVIVGFSYDEASKRTIYRNGNALPAKNINPYLLDAPNIIIVDRHEPLSDVPKIAVGSFPVDGGAFVLGEEELADFVAREPGAKKYIRLYIGHDEMIKGKKRYCLWLKNCSDAEIAAMPLVAERVKQVADYRLASKKEQTRKRASIPTRLAEDRQPDAGYIMIPRTSSENRQYLPMAIYDSDVIAGDTIILPEATLYHFGVLNSLFHMAWMRLVCGRLKSDYRYSSTLVYNNFIWPQPSEAQRRQIETCAQAVLDARAEPPDATLARLYYPDNMPDNLRAAHQRLDAAVEAAYGVDFGGDEERIVEHLFKLYAQAAADAKK